VWGPIQVNRQLARRAAEKIQHMAYVGVLEYFDSSICLFHRFYGGIPNVHAFNKFNEASMPYKLTPNPKPNPNPNPNSNLLPHIPSVQYPRHIHNVSLLRGTTGTGSSSSSSSPYYDELDEIVFKAVLDRFTRDIQRFIT
jgi:hypothetical protein